MIWALLVLVGVPLWLCATAIVVTVRRNRALRRRPGNVPARVRPPGRERWLPGHGVWVHDVFAFRRSPAAWKDALLWVTDASAGPASAAERKGLHRAGDAPVVATFELAAGGSIDFAARAEDADALLGPFADAGVPGAASEDAASTSGTL